MVLPFSIVPLTSRTRLTALVVALDSPASVTMKAFAIFSVTIVTLKSTAPVPLTVIEPYVLTTLAVVNAEMVVSVTFPLTDTDAPSVTEMS